MLVGLAANSPANQQAIAAAGGVEAVLGAMRAHPEAVLVQGNGCSGARAPLFLPLRQLRSLLRAGPGGGSARLRPHCVRGSPYGGIRRCQAIYIKCTYIRIHPVPYTPLTLPTIYPV